MKTKEQQINNELNRRAMNERYRKKNCVNCSANLTKEEEENGQTQCGQCIYESFSDSVDQ